MDGGLLRCPQSLVGAKGSGNAGRLVNVSGGVVFRLPQASRPPHLRQWP